jgi:heme oxygenase
MSSVYSKGNKSGEIREVTMIERFFDIEGVRKESIKLAEDKKKVEAQYKKDMEFITATEKKIAQILDEAEKLGLLDAEKAALAKVEESVKAEAAAEEEK